MINVKLISTDNKNSEDNFLEVQIELPVTQEKIEEALKIIKSKFIDDYKVILLPFSQDDENYYSEIFESFILDDGVDADIEEFNNFFDGFCQLCEEDKKKIIAINQAGYGTVAEALSNIDNYTFLEGINSYEALGQYFLYDSGLYNVPEFLNGYIDTNNFARDLVDSKELTCKFTSYGWVQQNN